MLEILGSPKQGPKAAVPSGSIRIGGVVMRTTFPPAQRKPSPNGKKTASSPWKKMASSPGAAPAMSRLTSSGSVVPWAVSPAPPPVELAQPASGSELPQGPTGQEQ